MPIINTISKTDLGVNVLQVNNAVSRMIGLIGSESLESDKVLYLTPCSGIHTFGMKYPIDVVFLDKKGTVIHTITRLLPKKITKVIPSAAAIIEGAAGFIQTYKIRTGDILHIQADMEYKPSPQGLSYLFHWPVNLFLAVLWVRFIINAAGQWIYQGGWFNFGVIIHNTILLILFISRRRSKDTSQRILDWIIPIATLGCAMLLKPDPFRDDRIVHIAIAIQSVGLCAMIASVLSLGKSFGIIPANRQVKNSGAYRFVRHPLYASEIIFHSGFLLGNYSLYNVLLVLFIFSGQIWRALSEEKLLSRDPLYQNYLSSVRFRFVPGVF